jgi:hypothetical protein
VVVELIIRAQAAMAQQVHLAHTVQQVQATAQIDIINITVV